MYQVFSSRAKYDNRDGIVGNTIEPVSPKYTLNVTAHGYLKVLQAAEDEQSERYFFVAGAAPHNVNEFSLWPMDVETNLNNPAR